MPRYAVFVVETAVKQGNIFSAQSHCIDGIPSFSSTICRRHSLNKSCATGFDSFDLAQVDGLAVEAGRELRDVKGNALGRKNRAELVARGATNAGLNAADGPLKRAVLLGVVTVGAERVVSGGSITTTVVCGETLGKLS